MIDAAYISGVAMTRFGKQPERTIEELGREALLKALKDAGIERRDVDEVFCGSLFGGTLIGQRILRDIGMTGIPITNVENACSSSTTALREACAAVAVGRAETVLVIGVDQLTRLGGGTIPLEKTDIEVTLGLVMPGLYAMRARRYMHETGATRQHLAMVAAKAHEAGALNPYAQFQNRVTPEEVLASRMIADPLTLVMCCPTGDGAAASVLQSGLYKTGFRDMASSELTRRTSKLAYESAGIGPEDIDLAEIHDAFTIAEMMYYEALGFCGKGGALGMVERGDTSLGGAKPVNPSGGLLCRGHPVGATGVAQVCEAAWQLRRPAGPRQIPLAEVALTQCPAGRVTGRGRFPASWRWTSQHGWAVPSAPRSWPTWGRG